MTIESEKSGRNPGARPWLAVSFLTLMRSDAVVGGQGDLTRKKLNRLSLSDHLIRKMVESGLLVRSGSGRYNLTNKAFNLAQKVESDLQRLNKLSETSMDFLDLPSDKPDPRSTKHWGKVPAVPTEGSDSDDQDNWRLFQAKRRLETERK